MAKESRCDLTSATTPGNWTKITFNSGPFDLLDFSDGLDIGWDWTFDNVFGGAQNLGVNAPGTGDASWVDIGTVSSRMVFASDDLTKCTISGLDDAKTYLITVFGSYNSAQACESWINGDTGNKLNHEPNANSTLVNAHFAYSPSGGVITIEFGQAGATNNITSAVRIQEQDAAAGDFLPAAHSTVMIRI